VKPIIKLACMLAVQQTSRARGRFAVHCSSVATTLVLLWLHEHCYDGTGCLNYCNA
jgi:hypothetical protein